MICSRDGQVQELKANTIVTFVLLYIGLSFKLTAPALLLHVIYHDIFMSILGKSSTEMNIESAHYLALDGERERG